MNIIAVIPARYDSTRFPGKVLANKTGKFLVQHTAEQVLKAGSVSSVLVATDSQKVFAACETFEAACAMTSHKHKSGTDRIAEAVADIDADIIINVQADEPEISPEDIDLLASLLVDNPDAQMATLVTGIEDQEMLNNPNVVKCVTGIDGRALYFSRSPIPYNRQAGSGDMQLAKRHLGIYAYRRDFLLEITKLPQSPLEVCESLEQLRVLENGYKIMTAMVENACEGIDTEEQYERFVERYNSSLS
ncbi:3-deoxy-manno-octulosonate cytidylyltransferase [Limihaloglobus sulfuriphilus]|uniref:3-deoxy-manno-octulosonate cytidylyltransferase n=1 Tax=Limihaloglobus sulfuriphilus TaxID=1851148 RepID=UPI0011BAC8D3|nr:3-deoxy-manno-octulosonate cytidylyltransferase [Limihaloglobus sulfuriphilus]